MAEAETEIEMKEPPRERLLTFNLTQLETDSESKQKERAKHINRVVTIPNARTRKIFRKTSDIWRKKNENEEDIWRWRIDINDVAIKDQATENGPTCCDPMWRFLGGREVAGARLSLFMIILDWVVDFSVGIYYLYSAMWTNAALTFLIVFGGGTIVTFANFSPHELDKSEIKTEMWKMSGIYGMLMHIPSFYPICTTRLLLHYVKKLASVGLTERYKNELTRRHKIVEEKALWDMSCESTFEAFPQAILQIIIVFDQYMSSATMNADTSASSATTSATTSAVSRYLGFILPTLSIIFSVYDISMAPISVIRSRSSDFVLKFGERLAAFSTQALRVFACALFIMGCRTLLRTSDSILMDTLWTTLSAILIFAIFDVPYIIRYEIEKRRPDSSLATINTVIDTIFFVATLGAFQLWIISWVEIVNQHLPMFITTAVVYCVFMLLTYSGLFYYRNISVPYRNVAASVIVYAYDGAKRWILSVCGLSVKRDRSLGPVVA